MSITTAVVLILILWSMYMWTDMWIELMSAVVRLVADLIRRLIG